MHVAGVLVVLRLVYDPVRRRAEPSMTPEERNEAASNGRQPGIGASLQRGLSKERASQSTHSPAIASPTAERSICLTEPTPRWTSRLGLGLRLRSSCRWTGTVTGSSSYPRQRWAEVSSSLKFYSAPHRCKRAL
jgi:hypothetical protein